MKEADREESDESAQLLKNDSESEDDAAVDDAEDDADGASEDD